MSNVTGSDKLNIRVLGAGHELVLLHGWGMNCGAFEHWLPYLGEHYRMTLIDLPGFGINHQVVLNDYSLNNICYLLESVIPKNAVVIGWSLGGLIAQCLAYRSQVSIRGLVVIASSACFVQDNDWVGIKEDVLVMFAKQLRNSYEKTLDRFLAIQSMGSINLKREIRELKAAVKHYPEPCAKALAAGLDLLASSDIRKSIGQLNTPTLRLYGKKDSLVPVAAADCINELDPNSETVVISEAAHAPFISHPKLSAHIVNEFIGSLVNVVVE